MMIGKSIFIAFLLVAVASATVPTRKPVRPKGYVFTPHARAVAKICRVATEKRLCCKALKRVHSDDPKDLVLAYVTATAAAMTKSVSFINAIRPKYQADATATTCLDVCEKQIKYGLEDLATFKQKAGTGMQSLAMNYSTLLELVRSVYRYHSGCLDDISDENLLKVVGDGIGEGRNMSSNAVDIFYMLNDVFVNFGVRVNLV